MNSEVNLKTEQEMDPVTYLNSISSPAVPDGQSQSVNSGVSLGTPKRKWPIILLIVLVVALIIAWLVAIWITKNAPGEGDTSISEQNAEEVTNATFTTLTCDKSLNSAELAEYSNTPLSGTRNYFVVYDGEGLVGVSQYTELIYETEELAEKATTEERDNFRDYYENKMGLSEDPFDSSFRHLEEENTLSISFDVEKDEIALDSAGWFVVPEDDVSMDDAQGFYERVGYVCLKSWE